MLLIITYDVCELFGVASHNFDVDLVDVELIIFNELFAVVIHVQSHCSDHGSVVDG